MTGHYSVQAFIYLVLKYLTKKSIFLIEIYLLDLDLSFATFEIVMQTYILSE